MVGRRNSRVRREPVFDVDAKQSIDLRLRPQDRPGGTPSGRDKRPAGKSQNGPRSTQTRRSEIGTSARPRRKRGGRGGGGRSRIGRALYWGAVLSLWGLIAGIGTIVWIGINLPPIQSLEIPKRPPSIAIVGLDGKTLATRGDMGGAAVPIGELPPYLPNAFIAIEDRRFYAHHGIDPIGLARAFVANVLHLGVSQGGSTITQQLAKNLFLTPERTFKRKLHEIALALWLEHKYSKTQILSLYLNRVYFGAGAYGVEAASQRYFGKSARFVTLAEAAMLAGLVKSPSRLAPSHNPKGAERRGRLVLAAMAEQNLVPARTVKIALEHPAHAIKQVGAGSANYVADWIMDVLNDLIGRVDQDLIVVTSIDPTLQSEAERALVDTLAQKGARAGVGQGALVAMTPNGAVRAMVGGRNYGESQFNRAVAAKRQPGSAFKPFVYLTALERGLSPDAVRTDAPINVKGWRPKNYSHQYFGPVTLTQGLALSLNTVAVRLTLEFGPTAVVRTAHRLGIASKLKSNPSIALGTSEVSPIELVSAYAAFANGGLSVEPHVVERVRTVNGRMLYARTPQRLGRIVEPRYVAMMNTMMRETLIIGTAKRARLPGWQAAGKTGTSQDFRDAWFVGYTSALVAGVWLGNDDGSPASRTTGGGLPVAIWSQFMNAAHRGIPVAGLPGLPGGVPMAMQPAPADVPAPTVAVANNRTASRGGGMDNWLLEKLFGR